MSALGPGRLDERRRGGRGCGHLQWSSSGASRHQRRRCLRFLVTVAPIGRGPSLLRRYLPYLAWAQAFAATLGSLFFSEVLHLSPCVLCWYQRILMYPLVVILAVGIVLRDARLRLYVLPLSLTGVAVAIYHNLLYYGVLPEGLTQCALGVSCTERQLELFGFVTIPLMSLTAFAVITLAIAFYRPEEPADA